MIDVFAAPRTRPGRAGNRTNGSYVTLRSPNSGDYSTEKNRAGKPLRNPAVPGNNPCG